MKPPRCRLYHAARAAAALALLLPQTAEGHTVGLSQSDFVVTGAPEGQVRAELVFARTEALALLGDGSDADVRDAVDKGVDVRADGRACPASRVTAAPVASDGLRVDATFACDHAPRALTVTLYWLSDLPPSHRHLLRIAAGAASTQVTLHDAERSATLRVLAPDGSDGAPPPRSASLVPAVRLGLRHILLGADHLLFLLALVAGAVMERARARRLVLVVTSFTAAHSITLAVGALGLVTPPVALVEVLIAASIAYVGLENLAARRAVPRVLTTFAFGLIHGLGFASTLRDLELARGRLLPTLLGFNLGVEVGQVAVVLALYAALRPLARTGRSARPLRVVSLAVAATGATLVVARVALALVGRG